MKPFVSFFFLLSTATFVFATVPDLFWTKNYESIDGQDFCTAVKQTADDGYILGGYTQNSSGYELFMVKTSNRGVQQWTSSYRQAYTVLTANDVATTSDGGYLLAGFSGSNLDACLLKVDSDGDTVFFQSYGGERDEVANAVLEHPNGHYYLTGRTSTYGRIFHDLDNIIDSLYSNIYLVEINPNNGDAFDFDTFGDSLKSEEAKAMIVSSDGDLIIAGYSIRYILSSGYKDMYVLKTSSSGTARWENIITTFGDDEALAVLETSDGGYAICGLSLIPSDYNQTFSLAKVDSAGNLQWTQTLGTSFGFGGFAATQDGGFLISGYTLTADFLNTEPYLVRADSLGNLIWEHTYPGVNGYLELSDFIASDSNEFVSAGSLTTTDCDQADTKFFLAKFGTPELAVSGVSADSSIEFPPTLTTATSALQLTVTNTGGTAVVVDSIITNGHIFTVTPSSFTVNGGAAQIIEVSFSPTFSYNFEGRMEIYSDAKNPHQVVGLKGEGCKPVVTPGVPRLFSAGSPNHLYFAMPWDENGESARYAVEYSSDGFAHSKYVRFPIGALDTADYHTASEWGLFGNGLISGLTENTAYQVKLRVKDCAGNMLTGTSTSMTTPANLSLQSYGLTLHVVNSDTVELKWNTPVIDNHGHAIPDLGWEIRGGNQSENVNTILDTVNGNSFRVSASGINLRFFTVTPILDQSYSANNNSAHPFIAWPPNDAVIGGACTVMIQDLLHKDSWDSFRVEIDSAGSWALVGSNFDNAWTNADQRQATAGLSRYGIGQHTLMATVIDTDGVVTRDSVEVTILREPNSTFSLLSAEDNSKGTFVIVDTLNAVTNDYALDEIIWITSGEGERYGSPMSLQWDGKSDPLLMKPFLKTSQKVLTQGQGWYNSSDENAGITRCLSALASTGLLSALNVKRCAQKMELHKEGEFTIGRYATSSIPQKLGPAFTYDIDTDVAFYGYSFEVEITFEKPNYNPDEPLLFGQDVKRTGVKSRGICDSNGLFTSSQTDITSKHYEGNEFPFSGESYGKDAYYFNDDQPNLDQFKSIAGKVYWLDTPGTRLSDISSHAMTDFTHLGFYAKASPPCQPEGMDVCMTWEVELYVLTCEEGIFNTNSPYFAPTIENEEHPTSCHSLAGE